MRRYIFVCLCVLGVVTGVSSDILAKDAKPDSCVACHLTLADLGEELVSPAVDLDHDVHFKRGISCADCHGGDPADPEETSMAPEKGFKGVPARSDIPDFCARCHADPGYMRTFNPNLPTDQLLKYHVSQHGKLLAQGDQKVAVCTSCHGAHGIRDKNDPDSPVFRTNAPATCAKCHANPIYMKDYGIPTNQFDEYSKSVHGQALLERKDRAAPACHNCHGSHDAARPGSLMIANVCAQCHSQPRDLFIESPHKPVHERMKLTECEVCHGYHGVQKTSDEMLGTSPGAVCIKCHDPGTKGFQAALDMKSAIEGLKSEMDHAGQIVGAAEEKGMEVSEAVYDLDEARNQLTKARAYIHAFSPAKVKEITDEGAGIAQKALAKGQAAMGEFFFRRRGLFVSLGIIIFLIVIIRLKIRKFEKEKPF